MKEPGSSDLKKGLVVFDILNKCLASYFLIASLPEIFNEAIKKGGGAS